MTAEVIARGQAAEHERAHNERAGFGRNVVVAALGVAVYMAALDISIVNAVLPVIAEAFGTDLSSIEWVVTSYLLVQSTLMLTFGRLGDLWGHKRVYLLGLGIFVASSLLCGFAGSTPALVGARVLQALGASMIFANLPAILIGAFPPEQRGRAVGIQATIIYVGLASGAPLGGWLTGVLGWQSVFYVNVPFGLAALALGARLAPADAPAERRESFDLVGAGIYAVGLGLLLLGLNQGAAWGWTSTAIVGCLLIGALLMAAWVFVELRVPSPMIDLRLFERRAFSAPIASTFLSYAASASTTLMVPFALIQGRGLSPAQVGLILTCQPIVMAVAASFSGALSDRVGTRAPTTLGMVVLASGLFLLSRLDDTTSVWTIAAMMTVTGLGIGLFTSPISSAVLGAVPAHRRGVANGVLGTARNLGMVLGVGIAGAVYTTTFSLIGVSGTAGVLMAADTALLVASGIALAGAVTSALPAGRSAEAI
jgi:EmrB/QacA subfamily drug resistance transporter